MNKTARVVPAVVAPGTFDVEEQQDGGGSCSYDPKEEKGSLCVPFGEAPGAVAVRCHEYAHLALMSGGEPVMRSLVDSAGLSVPWAQALTDHTANRFARGRGLAKEIANLPVPSGTEACRELQKAPANVRGTWYVRLRSLGKVRKGSAADKLTKALSISPTQAKAVDKVLARFDKSDQSTLRPWQEAALALQMIFGEEERKKNDPPEGGEEGAEGLGATKASGADGSKDGMSGASIGAGASGGEEEQDPYDGAPLDPEEIIKTLESTYEERRARQRLDSAIRKPPERDSDSLSRKATDKAPARTLEAGAIHAQVGPDRITLQAPAGSRVPWGPMEIVKLQGKDYRPKTNTVGRVAGFTGPLVYPFRATVASDGRAFLTLGKAKGGTLLVDCSGSMELPSEELESLLRERPAMTIGIYGAGHKRGRLVVLADRGRVVRDAAAVREKYVGAGNVVDGPALIWLTRQRRPRVWISDGVVTGIGDVCDFHLADQCGAICKRHAITRIRSLKKYLTGKAVG